MTFARWSFALAGLYGLVATLSLYFRAPLAAGTQWLYAFAGAAAATQLAYWLIATDPRRYRGVIPVGIVSKLSFAVPMTILAARAEVPASAATFAGIDYALAALFALNWVRLGREPDSGPKEA